MKKPKQLAVNLDAQSGFKAKNNQPGIVGLAPDRLTQPSVGQNQRIKKRSTHSARAHRTSMSYQNLEERDVLILSSTSS